MDPSLEASGGCRGMIDFVTVHAGRSVRPRAERPLRWRFHVHRLSAAPPPQAMNYRHAFHAGNFADVHKHAVLARILVHLRLKPAAFRVIDTHAGAGRYDLRGPEPSRSGEWHDGIERVWHAPRQGEPHALLAPYLDAVAALNPDATLRVYPGSPLIVTNLMRPQDRL